MRGIKLNMMHKIKNARHKINMVRKKKEEEKGYSKEEGGGESRNRKRRRRERKKKKRWARDQRVGEKEKGLQVQRDMVVQEFKKHKWCEENKGGCQIVGPMN